MVTKSSMASCHRAAYGGGETHWVSTSFERVFWSIMCRSQQKLADVFGETNRWSKWKGSKCSFLQQLLSNNQDYGIIHHSYDPKLQTISNHGLKSDDGLRSLYKFRALPLPLKLTFSPLTIRHPKRKLNVPTIHFQGRAVSFQWKNK